MRIEVNGLRRGEGFVCGTIDGGEINIRQND
jgi:hypothetical protein